MIFSIKYFDKTKNIRKVIICMYRSQSVFEAYPKRLRDRCIKNAIEITCTINKAMVNPLLRWLLSLYTLMYLSEKIKFIKSPNFIFFFGNQPQHKWKEAFRSTIIVTKICADKKMVLKATESNNWELRKSFYWERFSSQLFFYHLFDHWVRYRKKNMLDP